MCFFSKKKIAVLIISRTNSKRLKNKAKLKINGINLIEILVKRILKKIDKKNLIICSSNEKNNDKRFYKNISKKFNIGLFFGSEKNVLKRIIDCLEKNKFKHFVRITGDNPLVDINCIKKLSIEHVLNDYDYTFTDSLPMGMKSEVFSLKALKKNYKNILDLNSTEYLTYYFRRPDIYKIKKVNFNKIYKNQEQYKISIDKKEEFEILKTFLFKKRSIFFKRKEIITFLKKNTNPRKKIKKINLITKEFNVKYTFDKNKSLLLL